MRLDYGFISAAVITHSGDGTVGFSKETGKHDLDIVWFPRKALRFLLLMPSLLSLSCPQYSDLVSP